MAKQKKQVIVSKDSLTKMLCDSNEDKRIAVCGRALVAIFRNQTEMEQKVNVVNTENGIGFTGSDGRSGCISAKYYIKHKTLLPWMVDMWTKTNVRGTMRLAKYHRQLNEVAVAKAVENG